MAIVQISKIQQRRGLQQDLPQLASAELGWSVDAQKLYIGNGTLEEGAPDLGLTEILTENSVPEIIAQLQTTVPVKVTTAVAGSSSGTIAGINANTTTVSYSLYQGANQRTGIIKAAHNGPTVTYEEDYTETATTDITFSMTANISYLSLNYSTSTASTITYIVHTPSI
jgi:hypothetical protein